jgi:hypothetical protein
MVIGVFVQYIWFPEVSNKEKVKLYQKLILRKNKDISFGGGLSARGAGSRCPAGGGGGGQRYVGGQGG